MKQEFSREIFKTFTIYFSLSCFVLRYRDRRNFLIERHNFDTQLKIRCTSTEDLWILRPSYRQCSRYYLTLCQVNTAKHAVHWLTEMFWNRKIPISNIKLIINHSEFHCSIVWYHSLLRQFTCLPDTFKLLRATERTVIWWEQCA